MDTRKRSEIFAAFAAFVVCLALAAGCNNKDDGGKKDGKDGGKTDGGNGGKKDDDGGNKLTADMVSATIKGTVKFEGEKPAEATIDINDAVCKAMHAATPRKQDGMIVVDAAGGLASAQVYIKSGLADYDYSDYMAEITTPELDQKGCLYAPFVLGVMTNQDVLIKNSDNTDHNIRFQSSFNGTFNINQTAMGQATKTFESPEMWTAAFACDKHSWMKAYMNIFEHPFHTASTDDGSYEIKVPPGEYEVAAEHNVAGKTTAKIKVAAGETATLDLTIRK